MAFQYIFPEKLPTILRRLDVLYRQDKKSPLGDIIRMSAVGIDEGTSFDNWDGGTTGHGVTFYVEEEIIEKIASFDEQDLLCERVKNDLNRATRIPGEHIDWVSIELLDPNGLRSHDLIRPSVRSTPNPDSLGIWQEGHIRLFVSHRDEYKRQVKILADQLEEYGISSFVAHANIQPMEEWQEVIRQGLQTMEVMLLFITDDFFESAWTNQEIGVALERGIPIISLKLENTDPRGFIASTQALIGELEDAGASVRNVYRILAQKLDHEERLRKALVQAFVDSPDFDVVRKRFNRLVALETLTDSDVQKIIAGFSKNSVLRGAWYLTNESRRLLNFLENRTGKSYALVDGSIIEQQEAESELEDELPF